MHISSICFSDYVNIIANYISIMDGLKDAETELRTRGYSEEQIKAVRKTKNITHFQFRNLRFTAPLTTFKYPLMDYVFVLSENYEKGNLPFPGVISEQPSQVMDILNLVQLLKIEHQNRTQKKNQDNGRHNKDKSRASR